MKRLKELIQNLTTARQYGGDLEELINIIIVLSIGAGLCFGVVMSIKGV